MTKRISKLHFITQEIPGTDISGQVEKACLGKIDWVQFRVKNKTSIQIRELAREVQEICIKHRVAFIINDDVYLARELAADGVHLGKTDMQIDQARAILGPDAIIGATANTAGDIRNILQTSADYIGLGPFRFTTTKENLSPILGLEGITGIMQQVGPTTIPVIAIGGIAEDDLEALMQTGVNGIAVSGAINRASDPVLATTRFVYRMEKHLKPVQ
jgi:thiamine-phosphate pyrophosphorylase